MAQKNLLKLTATPVRLDEGQTADLKRISRQTGLSKSALLRLAVDYVLPRIVAGEINLIDGVKKKGAA